MYKERIRKILTGLLVLCMVFSMNDFASVSAAKKVAAKKVEITNAYTVMAVGQSANFNCKLTPSKSTDKITWKTSDKSIASPDKNGKFTALKSGTVTITAKASSGVKASVKLLVVSKNGYTSLQSRVDKMLAAKNIKKITINNLKTESSYVIPAGKYSDKTLTVNAPLSEVENNGRFKKIVVNDVKNGTFKENVSGNNITISDTDCTLNIAKGATVFKLSMTKANGNVNIINNGKVTQSSMAGTVNISGTGTFRSTVISKDAIVSVAPESNLGKVMIGGNAKNVTIDVKGNITTIVVNTPTDIKLTGDVPENVLIQFTAGAEGSTITSSVPVSIVTATRISVDLEKGAEGSNVEVTNNLNVNDVVLENNTTVKIAVAELGQSPKTQEKKEEEKKPEQTGGNSQSGTNAPVAPVEKTVAGTVSGSAVAFVLPTSAVNLKNVTVNAKVLGSTVSYRLTADTLAFVRRVLEGDADSIQKWNDVTSKEITHDNFTVTVTGEKGAEKTVKFGDITVKVEVQGTTGANAKIIVKKANSQYTLTKSADNTTLYISGSNLETIRNMVTFDIIY